MANLDQGSCGGWHWAQAPPRHGSRPVAEAPRGGTEVPLTGSAVLPSKTPLSGELHRAEVLEWGRRLYDHKRSVFLVAIISLNCGFELEETAQVWSKAQLSHRSKLRTESSVRPECLRQNKTVFWVLLGNPSQ